MNVLLIQRKLAHYRVPIFNALADLEGLDLTVVHSGSENMSAQVHFREIVVDCIRFRQIHYMRGVVPIADCYDVVVAPLNPRSIESVLVRARSHKYKVIYWGHGMGTSSWGNRLRAHMAQWADASILYGEEGRREFITLGGDRKKLFVAPNTIYVSNAEFNPDVTRRSFLFVGRIQRRKGVSKLLKAFATCVAAIPAHIRIEVVGEGDLRRELENLARELGIAERVTFWGRITDDLMLQRIFQRALAYVSPDHVGLGVLHSFAYGVPVVTRRSGAHAPEVENITSGVTGILCSGSVSSLTRVICHLAHNPDKSVSMGQAAYRHYRNHRSIVDMVRGFSSALEYVSSRSRSHIIGS